MHPTVVKSHAKHETKIKWLILQPQNPPTGIHETQSSKHEPYKFSHPSTPQALNPKPPQTPKMKVLFGEGPRKGLLDVLDLVFVSVLGTLRGCAQIGHLRPQNQQHFETQRAAGLWAFTCGRVWG